MSQTDGGHRIGAPQPSVRLMMRLYRCWTARRAILQAVAERDHYIAANRLDPSIWNPAANWAPDAPNDYLIGFRELSNSLKALSRLRPLARSFTGYDIAKISTDPGAEGWIALWKRLTEKIDRRFHVIAPSICGEVGTRVRGGYLNYDTFAYQERVNLLVDGGAAAHLDGIAAPTILEIGGGYGALARALCRSFPRARYVICDLPESLMYAGLYLASAGVSVAVWPRRARVTLLPNYRFGEMPAPVDLAINTLSMSEMTEAQVHAYCEGLKPLLGDAGMFFEQNQDNTHLGMLNAPVIVAQHFGTGRRIDLPYHGIHQGAATFWCNGDPGAVGAVA